MMNLGIEKTELQAILHLRNLFLQECDFQVRYNACHERGWTDSYIIKVDGITVGYGAVKGKDELSDRDAIFEFYIMPAWRKDSSKIFHGLITASKVSYIECQSNDLLLSQMLYEFSSNICSDTILFKTGPPTDLSFLGAIFREWHEGDKLFEHKAEPEGSHVIEFKGEIVATGGFLLHYNKPFADLYMEVRTDMRRKGFGSLLIQEVKKACYQAGRVPAARCGIGNKASKATLLKGGLSVAGYMLTGDVKF
jgi:GNAT superfamily N-acetyltransferase